MSRRQGSRRDGRAAARRSPTAYGYSGWDTTNILATGAAPAGLPGTNNTAMFRAGAIRIDSQAVAGATRYISSSFSGGTGWRLLTTGTNAALTFDVIDSGVVFRTAAAYTITAADVGKVIHWAGFWDGSNVYLAVRGVLTGAGTACATYLASTSSTLPGVRGNATLPADGVTWLGLVGGNATWTVADARSHYNACKAASRVVTVGGSLGRWDVGTSSPGAVAATLTGLDGAANLTFTSGSAAGLVAETINAPNWN